EVPAPRIPRVEDFPPHAQREMAAGRQPRQDDERGPLSLLRRLAGVGLGRRDEGGLVREEPTASVAVAPVSRPATTPQSRSFAQRAAQIQKPPAARPAGEAPAYRGAEGNLDAHGRVSPARAQDD